MTFGALKALDSGIGTDVSSPSTPPATPTAWPPSARADTTWYYAGPGGTVTSTGRPPPATDHRHLSDSDCDARHVI